MNKIETFQEFLATQGSEIALWAFGFNLLLTGFLAYLLSILYVRFGLSLSNRKVFSSNFVLMAMSTMFIITIVKSSLALSLGLVGALSIVRFRAAIKEPEELTYLFLTIAIGLGMGADQALITVSAFVVISLIIILRSMFHKKEDSQNLHFTISSDDADEVKVEKVIELLNKYCSSVSLKRLDESKDLIEASFLVEFDSIEQLNKGKEEIKSLSDSTKIVFLDTKSIMSY